ncbi:hypothetical protein M422DRAFT_253319 [Sphaerobolus stellatus SS14]|uniref:Uncharacterized protein n=1 Tax=Sphaerobolus stellatus (strain SS14) TaxID=990650 RepID=A0A0C9VYB5_SPHS4|nr:hypothetical protein M422DRAFT_253319 [Sphaerobolus stellatus SS14]
MSPAKPIPTRKRVQSPSLDSSSELPEFSSPLTSRQWQKRSRTATMTRLTPVNDDDTRIQASDTLNISQQGIYRAENSEFYSHSDVSEGSIYFPSTPVASSTAVWVHDVKSIIEPFENWPISTDPNHTVAYFLDLSNSPKGFLDAKGKQMSMSAIIKDACTDSWGRGTGGSLKYPTKVTYLGDIPCQKIAQFCSGVWTCSEVERNLWEDVKRYEYDFSEFQKMHELIQNLNEEEARSIFGQTATFFNSQIKRRCLFNEGRCKGTPILQKLVKLTIEGKLYCISCSEWSPSSDRFSHTFASIPSYVQDDILKKFFDTHEPQTLGEIIGEAILGPCGLAISPRIGQKLKQCPHVHVRDGKLVRGGIDYRPCSAKITIYCPIDQNIRKAIIIPAAGQPHSHPSFPRSKLTYDARIAYTEAIQTLGVGGVTVEKVDQARTTMAIFGGKIPQAVFPALANSRMKSELIARQKKKKYAAGTGFMGVMARYREDLKLPIEERYIHYISTVPSEDGEGDIELIVTMNPRLAKLVHSARATLHDTTYKRVFGLHNEWEVVLWDEKHSCYVEMDKWCEFCSTHPEKKVRDWYANKAANKWYLPSLVQYLSKIPPYDWITNRGDTNLKESSHPATNRFTGINLSLMEAIEGAEELDEIIADKLDIADANCMPVRQHNTLQERLTKNVGRANSRAKKNHTTNEAQLELDTLNKQIKDLGQQKKDLEQRKKVIKHANGVRERRPGIATKGKLVPSPIPLQGAEGCDLEAPSNGILSTGQEASLLLNHNHAGPPNNFAALGFEHFDPDLEPPSHPLPMEPTDLFPSSTAPPAFHYSFNFDM